MKRDARTTGEIFTHGEELFMGISLLTALTLAVLMMALMIFKALPAKYAPPFLAVIMACVVLPAFVMHWVAGWLALLVASLMMALAVAERRKIMQKKADEQQA